MCLCFVSTAQVKLQGSVTNNTDATGLANVSVFIKELKVGTLTNATGQYAFLVDSGTYTIQFALEGYSSQSRSISTAEPATNVALAADAPLANTASVPTTTATNAPATNGPTFKMYGVVSDENKNTPLSDVAIQVKGTTTGTLSDMDGKYELNLPYGTHAVEFRYTGYGSRTIVVTSLDGKAKQHDVLMTDESTELDIVVVTTDKYEKKLGSEVVTMEVLKAGVITQSNAKMDEALNKVPGVNMLGKSISIRGGSGFSDATGNRVLALLDDMPIISPENGGIVWEMIPIEALEQVEIIKGSTSAQYGASALNGVLNLRTITPKKEAVNKLLLNYGFYDQPRQRTWNWWWKAQRVNLNGDTVERVKPRMFGGGQFVHSKLYGDFGVVLAASYLQDMGFRQHNDYKRARLSAKLRYVPHKKPNFTVGLNMNFFHQTAKDFFASQGIAYRMYMPTEVVNVQQRSFNIDPYLNYYNDKGDRHSLKFRLYNTMYNSTTGDSTKNMQYYLDYTYSKRFDKLDLVITTGANGHYTTVIGKTFGDLVADIKSLTTFNTRDIINVSGFIQVEKKFFKKLTIAGGVSLTYARLAGQTIMNRLPLINAFKNIGNKGKPDIMSPVTPLFRVGLNYQATEGTYIRASFGQGSRYPAMSEKFVYTLRSGAQVMPNPDLRPENGWSAEIGIKQGVKISNWMAYFDLSGYIMRYHDMIEFQVVDAPDSINGQEFIAYGIPFKAINITNAQVAGVEFSTMANGKIFGVPLTFIIGYAYLDPRNLSYDPNDPNSTKILKYRIQHSFKADVQTTYKGAILGFNMFFNSFMKEIDNVGVGALGVVRKFRETHNKGDFVMDIRAGYNYKEKFTFMFICKNIFNREYTLRPALIEAPRNYTFQVGYNF
jgi:iron complex outermembrane receptor protein